jgi:ankyrin repeat protein
MTAIEAEHVQIVRFLISYGMDLDTPGKVSTALCKSNFPEHQHRWRRLNAFLFPQNDETPLHRASTLPYFAIVKALLEAGADPNVADKVSTCPVFLRRSVAFKNAYAMLDHNCAQAGTTPLMVAVEYSNWHNLKRLLEHGADVHAKDKVRAHQHIFYHISIEVLTVREWYLIGAKLERINCTGPLRRRLRLRK